MSFVSFVAILILPKELELTIKACLQEVIAAILSIQLISRDAIYFSTLNMLALAIIIRCCQWQCIGIRTVIYIRRCSPGCSVGCFVVNFVVYLVFS